MNKSLLTKDEKDALQRAVGARQTVVASAVARLCLASPDPKARGKNTPILSQFKGLSDESWTVTHVQGAVVFVIDRNTDSMVFQIYDLNKFTRRFECELYYDIEYIVLTADFHAFEMEECCAGFQFKDAAEAKGFQSKVMALKPSTKATGAAMLRENAAPKKKGGFFGGFFGGGSKKKRGQASSFDDDMEITIGEVREIKHEQHVGVNNDGTFDMKNLPPQWKAMFKQAGIKKKDLQDPETAAAIMQTIQQAEAAQELAEMYQQNPEYADMEEEQIEEAINDFTEEELEAYRQYKEDLRVYYEELAAAEAEQQALQKWEEDNLASVEEEKRRAKELADMLDAEPVEADDDGGSVMSGGGGVPPPLPPRKLQEAANELEKDVKVAQKQLKVAENNYRMSVRKAQKSPEQIELERAREEARLAAEEARRVAREAAAERDKILAELEDMKKKRNDTRKQKEAEKAAAQKAAAEKAAPPPSRLKTRLSFRKSTTKEPALPPPLPSSVPPHILDAPPPPPPPLPAAPEPPKMPEMPSLPKPPPRKADKPAAPKPAASKPTKPTKPSAAERPKQNTLMGAIQKGVELKKPTAPKPPGRPSTSKPQLLNLESMKPKAQNQLMAKLIETMNERRNMLGEEDDSEDEWSD